MANDNTILDYHETWNPWVCAQCGCHFQKGQEKLLCDKIFCSDYCIDTFLDENQI